MSDASFYIGARVGVVSVLLCVRLVGALHFTISEGQDDIAPFAVLAAFFATL